MRQAPHNKKNLSSIFWIIFLDEIGMTIGFPVLTFLCFDKKSSLFAITTSHAIRSYWYGIINSLPFIIALFSVPLLSWLSDHQGRKRILLLGAFGAFSYAAFTAAGILTGTIFLLIIGCIINGLFSRTEPVALAVIGDSSDDNNKMLRMGLLQFCIAAGAFLGPLIGGYFTERFWFHKLNFSMPYLIGAGFGTLTFVFVLLIFKETLSTHRSKRKISFTDTLSLLRNPQVIKISLALLLIQLSWRTYYQFIPPVLKLHFHYSATIIGIFIAVIALWLALAASLGLKFLANFFTQQQIFHASYITVFCGLLLANIANLLPTGILSQILSWIAAAPIAIGDVISYSLITTFYSNAVAATDQGKVMGINYIIYGSVWAMTGLIGGYLAAINVNAPIMLAPISIALLLLIKTVVNL
jgi:MFS family permease